MPGPMRRMARTAAVVGTTAHIASGRQEKKDEAAMAAQAPAPAPAPAEVAAAPVPVATGGMTDEKMNELQRLGQLKADGILTEEEFADAKAKILAS